MYIYVYLYVYICIYTYVYEYISMSLSTNMSLSVWFSHSGSLSLCPSVCVYVCVCVSLSLSHFLSRSVSLLLGSEFASSLEQRDPGRARSLEQPMSIPARGFVYLAAVMSKYVSRARWWRNNEQMKSGILVSDSRRCQNWQPRRQKQSLLPCSLTSSLLLMLSLRKVRCGLFVRGDCGCG